VTIFDEIVRSDELFFNDPNMIDSKSTKGQGLDFATTEFVANSPPSIARDKPYGVT